MISPEEIKFAPPEVQAEYAQQIKEEQETEQEAAPEKSEAVEPQPEKTETSAVPEADTGAPERKPAITYYQRMVEKNRLHLPELNADKLAEFGAAALNLIRKSFPERAKIWFSNELYKLQKGKEDKLTAAFDEKNRALQELTAKHEDFQNRMSRMAKEIGHLDPKIEAEIAKENKKFEKLKNDLSVEATKAEQKASGQKARAEGFEKKRDLLVAGYIEKIEQKITPIEQEMALQQNRLDMAEAEMAKLRDVIQTSQDRIAELETHVENSEYAVEKKAYAQEIKRLGKLIREKADLYNKQEQQKDRLADSLMGLQNRCDALNQKIEAVQVTAKEEVSITGLATQPREEDSDRPKSLFDLPGRERPYSLFEQNTQASQEQAAEQAEPEAAEQPETEDRLSEKLEQAVLLWNKRNGVKISVDKDYVQKFLDGTKSEERDREPEKVFEKMLVTYHRGVIRKQIKGQSAFANEGDLRREIKKFVKERSI